MKITFFSNYFNHHQLAISQEFIREGADYTFVATEEIPQFRLDFGYEDMNKKHEFVLTTYDSQENYEKALRLGIESDIVIIGSAPDIFIKERIKQNKIIFRYSERVFKKGRMNIVNIKTLIGLLMRHTRYINKNIYMLCSSAYAAKDYLLAGAYINKYYRWGYFVETIDYNIDRLIEDKRSDKIRIIWIGRFIKLKHPELVIELAKHLKVLSYNFEITMLGNGELLEPMKTIIKEENLSDSIKILGSVSREEVRRHMEKSNIHIFTSDQNEGWGAVLNEAMNSGCAVVANRRIGSVPYLIQDGKNGYAYNSKKELINKVVKLIEDVELREEMSKNAYYTIRNVWNAENAVKNLLKLYESISSNSKNNIENGPCSKDEEKL